MYKKIPTVSPRVPPAVMTAMISLTVMCLVAMAAFAARTTF